MEKPDNFVLFCLDSYSINTGQLSRNLTKQPVMPADAQNSLAVPSSATQSHQSVPLNLLLEKDLTENCFIATRHFVCFHIR